MLTLRVKRKAHVGRWVTSVVLVSLLAIFIVDASQRDAYSWDTVGEYLFDRRVVFAAINTLQLTLYSMIAAVVLGVVLALMRMSVNPILRSLSWLYIWIFRGTPVYVQLVFWGLLAVIYQQIELGLPFSQPWIVIDTKLQIDVFFIAIVGLALNEAAYMAEIVRAGIQSVDKGQVEAAKSLGMGWRLTTFQILLPQAMRVIIPPTGNEVISMLKTTSLVTAVPYSYDLYARTHDIAAETFNPIPLLIVASIWYLAFTSILMIGQHRLEKHFSKGFAKERRDA